MSTKGDLIRATVEWMERHALAVAFLLIIIATARIAATWRIFNTTTDEAAHIACGMEWLDRHTYRFEDQHPPLARVAVALGPYLFGIRSHGNTDISREGSAILLDQGHLARNLALDRAGTLPFFWIACVVVFIWARRLFGPVGAVLTLLLFTNLPPVLAHASLGTTDMALTGMLGALVLVSLYWLENPSLPRTFALGAAAGLAILSKFSTIPFFVSATACMFAWHAVAQPRTVLRIRARHLWTVMLSCAIASFVIWGGYWFSFGTVRGSSALRPAPEFFSGIESVRSHNKAGHLAYLLGTFSNEGFPLYYAVALAVKTPLPFLALLIVGIAGCVLRWRRVPQYGQPLAFAAGILAFAMVFSHINIGIRHVLPVYTGFSIVAASGLILLFHARLTRVLAAALLAWLIVSSVSAHPDYLAYFNEIAGDQPERILIDSDLDWGQDMKRLAIRLEELKVSHFSYLAVIFMDLAGRRFPPLQMMDIEHPSPGWHAAHITKLKLDEYRMKMKNPDRRVWTKEIQPVERIGRGILLWHLPD